MNYRYARWLTLSFGVLLLITGFAKVFSVFGTVRVLYMSDPIFAIQFRWLFLLVGALEILVAAGCFFLKKIRKSNLLVACLAANFLMYRSALYLMGWHRPCSCLGDLTDMLHISSQNADFAMRIVLAYLAIGSFANLFWLWHQERKVFFTLMALEKADGPAS